VLADDHAPARAGVRRSLEAHGLRVVGEAAAAQDAVALALDLRPDVCLLDVRMPGGGIAAAHTVASRLPETAVVMLTVSTSDEDLFDALRAGASGYLLKDTDPARLPLALEGVLRGEAALPRTLAARVLDEFRRQGRRRLRLAGRRAMELTGREWEVLELLRDGLTTADIAGRLSLSEVTVRRHISSSVAKLRVPDRRAAVRLLEESGS
jgi:DNA-binding NarL/FixJ family response regulator